jgi:hypothetical protein
MTDPTIEDARAALVRANRSGQRFDYITIYDRREAWLWKAAEIAVEHGWLEPGRLVELDEQSSELRYYVTEAGRGLR